MHSGRKGRVGRTEGVTCTHPATCEINGSWEAAVGHGGLSSVLCDDGGVGWGRGWAGSPKGDGHTVYVPVCVLRRV